MEIGWNYTPYQNNYLNRLIDSSNAPVGRRATPLLQKFEYINNPMGLSFGISIKVEGVFRTGVTFNYRRKLTRQIADHFYGNDEYHNVDFQL